MKPFLREHINQIVDRVVLETGVKAEALLGRCRTKSVAAARHKLFVALWMDEHMSLTEIGDTLGLHHTTVIHGLRKTLGAEAYGIKSRARYPREVA